ncbi:helix-turn-helix domain containing protein [Roseomonas sp. HJA6]|uniref:Helix-turn-helix domain containing protein n=1 Tax=Roseomonas alba TaxID=2846776 RepID=A0ABS7AB42_9PROT|nr:helix-turn-helix domain-containing protein [Neoroseomonas alba]MBW6399523.1 helix-turn-helix domain containing protein [Neoroseomonas alba]
MEADPEDGSGVPGSPSEGGSVPAAADEITQSRVARLEALWKRLGSRRKLAIMSGIPQSTLNGYLKGGALPIEGAVALARASGVRLNWLATGEEPMLVTDPAPAVLQPAPDQRHSAFRTILGAAEPGPADHASGGGGIAWQVNPERLARAYEAASRQLIGPSVTPTLLMRIALVIYDHLTEIEAGPKSSPTPD